MCKSRGDIKNWIICIDFQEIQRKKNMILIGCVIKKGEKKKTKNSPTLGKLGKQCDYSLDVIS